MSLFQKLQIAKSEEDVKDAYIKALGLKKFQKNLIDIQTDEIWFEAKEGGKTSTYAMFTQLLHYVQEALNKGEQIPPFLCVIDSHKAALMETKVALPLLEKRTIKWGKSASAFTQEALDAVSQYIGTHFVSWRIETHENEFIEAVKTAIRSGEIVRTQITPDNLKQVFDKWVQMIGREIDGASEDDYAVLFFADVMTDGTVSTHENLPAELLHRGTSPLFSLGGKLYELKNREGYRQFWAIYHRPPKEAYRNYLLERRDSLIPLDERSFKGAYYTPLHIVEKAYDLLSQTLGKNWQREYIVWDMCCGVGNLETKHSNPRNVYMSTLDKADVDVMKAAKTCVQAERFQYDYLNDDITADGNIDYALTQKVPKKLQDAIRAGKKILVLMNPPYAEAGGADNFLNAEKNTAKATVAKTKWAAAGMQEYGKASNELYTQFLARIAKEIPSATIAMFSTLKYVNAPNSEQFRQVWNAKYLNGFIVHSKAFDGLGDKFPIGFLIWQTDHNAKKKKTISEISVEVIDKDAMPIGEKKFYNIPTSQFLSNWIDRPSANKQEVVGLKNAIVPAGVGKWSDDAVAYLVCDSNDMQQAAQGTSLLSAASKIGHKGGFYVTPKNLWQAAIVFTARRIVKPTWINNRDQFLQPTGRLSSRFKTDCLVWMLFSGSNLTASANHLKWEDREWSIVNHFIPYTEKEVRANGRFESDFLVQYMSDKTFSKEAQAVLDAGRELWRAYFARTDNKATRDKFMLNRADVGWYQIRGALKERNESGDFPPTSFATFEAAYAALTEKLRPQVYELGFLR
ncbi:MAG: hypothetical protein ACRC46_12125 [Thermoguttaceae bacterium]